MTRSGEEIVRMAQEKYRAGDTAPLRLTLAEARAVWRYAEPISDFADEELDRMLLNGPQLPRVFFTPLRITDAPPRITIDGRRGLAFGREVAAELCQIFGLDQKLTERIVIEIDTDGPVRLETTRFVTSEESGKLEALARRYVLAQLDEDDDSDSRSSG